MPGLSRQQIDALQHIFRDQYQVQQPSRLIQFLFWGVAAALAIYGLPQTFSTEPSKRRCSKCLRTSHTVRNCPFVGNRRPIRAWVKKTGWCQCCGRRSRKTQLHHYGGRANPDKYKEMCRPCHLHCGHDGDYHNFAINPHQCWLVA